MGKLKIIKHITGPQTPTWVETLQYLNIINHRGKSISNVVSRRVIGLDVFPHTVGGPGSMSFNGLNGDLGIKSKCGSTSSEVMECKMS